MQVGIIGVGRMGRELARRLKDHVELTVFDRDAAFLATVQNDLGLPAAGSIDELAAIGTVILAVPDPEVINCIKDFNQLKTPITVINIATNVAQHVLEETAVPPVRCIGVKFVGQAGEMALGLDPVVVIDSRPAELVPVAQAIFAAVGPVLVGKADIVSLVNNIAGEKALEAAVHIEENLRQQGVTDPAIVKSAIRMVAAGIMKAYADQNLGPFARQIVRAIRAKMKK
jgi:3-hydroxyisobutyrate dehydrogenase-like beta-hydroxyacid dehydrogenase